MQQLLDAHSVLWFFERSPRLSQNARTHIEDLSNASFVSIVNIWEIAIKVSVGKLPLLRPFHELFPGQLNRNGIGIFDLSVEHTTLVTTLPFHHRDPFDRMLIAQALVENIPIISADSVFDQYGVTRIW